MHSHQSWTPPKDTPAGALWGPCHDVPPLNPIQSPGVWFHELPLLATIRGAIVGREENCSAGGGGVTRRPIFPTPPTLLGRRDGRGGSGRGCPTCRAGGGGGGNPTSMAQNDTHVELIILTTQMWGGKLLVEKTFSGQNLCSCAFGANIRSYTKQRARHGTPFLQPPPLLRRASMSPPPPPPQSNFQVAWRPMPAPR